MATSTYLPWFLLFCQLPVSYGYALLNPFPAVTQTATLSDTRSPNNIQLQERAISTKFSTCGYLTGDADHIRTANKGYDCLVDTDAGLWGFCTTTLTDVEDCNLAAACSDKHDCSNGCGMTGTKGLLTINCNSKSYCSLAMLTFDADESYLYIACGEKQVTDHFLFTTTTIDATTTSETSEPTTSSGSSNAPTSTSVGTTDESIVEATSAAPSQASTDGSSSSGNAPNNTGAIVGGVIGGLVLVCGTAIAVVYLLRKNRDRGSDSPPREQDTPKNARPWSFHQNKQTVQMGGWGPQELPAYTDNTNGQYGRENAVELAS
ncbi:hypothetical protein B0T10DRAFT_552252 [Thelonectria olida]|uniref:Uncharacterized protein n=1 Tax=Thelonectria olida TaxID=1576542 RepID=A0A9P8VX72_9HYPO|nr:hypothetical protein B0T10DRAFT_552252 [Thelonectria olida]